MRRFPAAVLSICLALAATESGLAQSPADSAALAPLVADVIVAEAQSRQETPKLSPPRTNWDSAVVVLAQSKGDLETDHSGDLWTADRLGFEIIRFDPDTAAVEVFVIHCYREGDYGWAAFGKLFLFVKDTEAWSPFGRPIQGRTAHGPCPARESEATVNAD